MGYQYRRNEAIRFRRSGEQWHAKSRDNKRLYLIRPDREGMALIRMNARKTRTMTVGTRHQCERHAHYLETGL